MFGRTFSRALALATVVTMLMTSVALADNVQNDVEASSGAVSITAGDTTGATVNYRIHATSGDSTDTTGKGGSNCNAADGTGATITPGGMPSGVTVSPTSLLFTTCGTDQGITFKAAAGTTPGDYPITVSVSDSGAAAADYNTSPGTFTLRVVAASAPSDTTAPQNASITIDDGATWTKSATGSVSLDLSATDNVGITKYRLAESQAALATATDVAVSPAAASFSALDVAFTITGSEAASKSVWLRVYDAVGNSAEASDTIGWDHTAPSVAYTSASGTAGDNGWYTSGVTATFTATDSLSGFGAPASLTTTDTATSSGEGAALSINSPSFTDNAGNTRLVGAASQSFKIDLTNPYNIAFVDGPAAGSSHYFGSVPAAPTCTADDDISGIRAIGGCVVTGHSSAVGSHTMTATATDNAGRTAFIQRSYTVLAWTLSGFYSPVDMGGVLNTVKAGSTVPLKFEIFSGSFEHTSTSSVDTFKVGTVPCGTLAALVTDDIENYSTGGTSLRYDSTAGQFIQNWQVPKTSSAAPVGTCYKVVLTTDDGSSLTAYFKTK